MLDRENELNAWDRDHFFHPSTHMGMHARGETPRRVIAGGEGCYIHDTNGKRSLDAFAGLYCVNVGYGRTEIADAIAEQARELAYYHAYVGHGTEASITLARMIIERAPANMSRVYFGLSGSDANETNIKLVWYYNNLRGMPAKKKIISRDRGYHGCSVVSGSMTGMSFYHDHMDLPMGLIRHTGAPHHYWGSEPGESEEQFSARRATELEAMILREGPDTVGAFIAEPVLGTGGITPPPAGYWAAIQAVLRKYDVLLIADEVITGFGRTGALFGCDKYDIEPDLITVAKGLPREELEALALASDKVQRALEGKSVKKVIVVPDRLVNLVA